MSNSATARRRHERDVRRRKQRQQETRAALQRMALAAARQFSGRPAANLHIHRDARGVFHINKTVAR